MRHCQVGFPSRQAKTHRRQHQNARLHVPFRVIISHGSQDLHSRKKDPGPLYYGTLPAAWTHRQHITRHQRFPAVPSGPRPSEGSSIRPPTAWSQEFDEAACNETAAPANQRNVPLSGSPAGLLRVLTGTRDEDPPPPDQAQGCGSISATPWPTSDVHATSRAVGLAVTTRLYGSG